METTNSFANDGSYIRKRTFIISTSIFSALGLLLAIIHLLFSLHQTRSIGISTISLLAGLLTVIASTATLQLGVSDIILATGLSTNRSSEPLSASTIVTAEFALRYTTVSVCLLWTAIFATKTALVCASSDFINAVARPSTRQEIYQYAVLAATSATWAFHMATPFIACPHRTGEATLSCPTNPTATARLLSTISIALDILTTLLVLALPTHHLLIRRRRYQTPDQKPPTILIPILATTAIALTTIIPSTLRTTLHTASPPFTLFLLSLEASTTLTATTLLLSHFSHHSTTPRPPSSTSSASAAKRPWRPGTLTARHARTRTRTESQERLRSPPPAALQLPVIEPGLHTVIESEGRRTPSRLVKTSLRRQESVLRTREVRVEVHYHEEREGDGDGRVWSRVASPSWVDEKWRVRPHSEGSITAGV